jgi:hypothetical protein
MTKPQYAQLIKDHLIRESAGASRLPMAPRQEVAHALIDMIVDRSISVVASAIAEVAFVNLIWPHFDHYIWLHPKAANVP